MAEQSCIADFMATKLVVLSPDMEVNRAVHTLLVNDVSGAPVVDDRHVLVGVFSMKDGLKAALNASYFKDWGAPVSKYMATEVVTLRADLSVVETAEVFLASPYRRFPVLRNGNLVGQVSRADVLRALAKEWLK